MSRLLRPAEAISIVLLLTVVNASASNNGSIVTQPNSNGVTQDPSQNYLVDCVAYTAARTSSSAAHATNVPQSTALFSNASIPQISVPFEEYWCEHYDTVQVQDPEEDGVMNLFKGLPAGSKSVCLPLEKASYSSWAATSTVSQWTPIVTPPCCDTYCDIRASAAQLYYWPATSTPHVTTMIGEGGFTFTYPSVYLVYIDISATGGCGVVGSTYTRLTQAYATGDLRTQLAQERAGDNPTLNLSDLFDNCTARGPTESYPRPVCVTQVGERLTSCLAQAESVNSKALFEQLHCYPSLYYPTTKLLEADPAWTTCIPPRLQPMFDPPRTLVPAAAMAPIPTSASHQPVAAVPASIVDPPRASKTPPPSKPESVPGSGNDPSGKDPPSQDPPKNGLHSGDPPLLSASASNHPVDDPPASDPPANKPLESGPSTRDPAASNPSANNPPIGKPPANVPMRNDPANGPSGNGSPIQDPQNSVKPAQNPSKDRSQYPSPSFAIPIPEGPTLPGIVINPSSVVVAGSTIRSGASAVQSKDHQVSLDPGAPNVIVDGQAHASSTTSPLPVAWGNSVPALTDLFTTPYGHNIQAAPNPGVISVDGQSITGGANSVTIASIPSAPHSNEDLALGISTIRGSLPPSTTSPQVFTAAGQAATVLPNGVAVAGTTIIPNAPAVVVAGTSYSLGTNGLIVGTSTMTYPTPAPSAIIIATGKATTPLANDHVIMSGSSSYAPGMTIGETPVSLGTNSLAVGTSTLALPSSPLTSSVVIVGEMLPSSLGTNVVAICSTTLQSIQTAITIPGTPVSLGTSGPATGSSTGLLSSTVSTDGVGGYVFSGFNGGMGSPSATSSVVILGSGARLKVRWSACTIIIVIVISFT